MLRSQQCHDRVRALVRDHNTYHSTIRRTTVHFVIRFHIGSIPNVIVTEILSSIECACVRLSNKLFIDDSCAFQFVYSRTDKRGIARWLARLAIYVAIEQYTTYIIFIRMFFGNFHYSID